MLHNFLLENWDRGHHREDVNPINNMRCSLQGLLSFGAHPHPLRALQGMYSYNHMTVANATHVYIDSYLTETQTTEDAVWIIQNRHGPRSV